MGNGVVSRWGSPFLLPGALTNSVLHLAGAIALSKFDVTQEGILTMDNFSAKDKQIFEDMKQCVTDQGLKILEEKTELGILSGISTFAYPSSLLSGIMVN
jgi:hypothetical protein